MKGRVESMKTPRGKNQQRIDDRFTKKGTNTSSTLTQNAMPRPGVVIITVCDSCLSIHREREVGLFFLAYENGSRMLVKDITSEPHFISGRAKELGFGSCRGVRYRMFPIWTGGLGTGRF
jgi:hypothetical protein